MTNRTQKSIFPTQRARPYLLWHLHDSNSRSDLHALAVTVEWSASSNALHIKAVL